VRGLYKFSDNRAEDDVGSNHGGYGLFDLFSGVGDSSGTWKILAWSKNLLSAGSTAGYTLTTVMSERTFGITGKYSF